MTPLIFDEIRDAVGDDPRLAAARPGEDEHRPVRGFNGFSLLRVELIQERQTLSKNYGRWTALSSCRNKKDIKLRMSKQSSFVLLAILMLARVQWDFELLA